MKKRAFKLFSATIILIVAGILYYLLNKFTGFAVPCLFYTVTGLKCPGCGITRMIFSLIKLDFVSAFKFNPAIITVSPLLIFLAVIMVVEYIKNGKMPSSKWINICFYILIAYFVIFGILRNIFIF